MITDYPTDLPFSQACENNREPIAEVLIRHLQFPASLLEIGSGTGQHGYYFSALFPELRWQPSDRNENLPMIRQWVKAADRDNFPQPLFLDVNQSGDNIASINGKQDYLFSANTLHIMSWQEVERFFLLVPQLLEHDGLLFVYGPFNYEGNCTSQSNADFDQWLKRQTGCQGIRDFADVNQLAAAQGLRLVEDNAMPANNRLVVWQFD